MFTPSHFAEHDLAALDALVTDYPFATLVTQTDEGPYVSHLPVLYSRSAGGVLIEGHWARANPQWRHTGEALLIVHGPHAYISPDWYPDRDEASRVPTWNYAVAHLGGTLETFVDMPSLADLVDRLSRQFEATAGSTWRFDRDRADLVSQLHGIVGFRLRPKRIEMKFKLNQNHPPANVQGAAAGLAAVGGESNGTVARMMLARLEASRNRESS